MSRGLLRSTMIASRGLASASEPYDLAVLGAGPGGYVAAIKASQLGLKVGFPQALLSTLRPAASTGHCSPRR
jgi:succinate dehydrogenase/fumarate reductase flavoprotein subunit